MWQARSRWQPVSRRLQNAENLMWVRASSWQPTCARALDSMHNAALTSWLRHTSPRPAHARKHGKQIVPGKQRHSLEVHLVHAAAVLSSASRF